MLLVTLYFNRIHNYLQPVQSKVPEAGYIRKAAQLINRAYYAANGSEGM